MKRARAALAAVLLVSGGALAYQAGVSCPRWQDTYKRFLYSEWIKNAPFIYDPHQIEEIIGPRPVGCARPAHLTEQDVERYRAEGVGPNEFLEEIRAAR